LDSGFWHERWEKNQLGFHNTQTNALLAEHWPDLAVDDDSRVFIPLCGKSLDMHWLRARGHSILGVELSPIALRDFFSEADLEPTQESAGALERWTSPGFDLYCGDLFDLNETHLRSVRACYDRGSLVALPPDIRKRYAEHLIRILPPRVTILMISLEYDQSRMNGPPHSVPPSEVEALFGADFEVETLLQGDWREASPMFRARGLDVRRDIVLRLDRRDPA
jgi:thiopurine S-methyltransferase